MTSVPILIKRYARSRLYDPAGHRYVTIDELRRWRCEGVPFQVIDAETCDDVTRAVLA
jgi:polyhydroxyalkanoate synthesis regulator protein